MPEIASAAQVQISIVEEVTRGTTPANPVYLDLPIHAGGFFQANRRTERSGIVRPNRMGGKQVGGTKDANGQITVSLVLEDSVRKLLESSISGAFSAVQLAAVSLSFASGTKKATRAAGGFLTDPAASKLQVGDKVAITGTAGNQSTLSANATINATTLSVTDTSAFSAAGAAKVDNEWVRYTGKTANSLTGVTRGAFGTAAATHNNAAVIVPVREITAISDTELTFGNDTVVTEAAVTVTVLTNRKRALGGTTNKFFSVAQRFVDIAAGEYFTGEEVNTLAINIPTTGEVTMQAAFVGLGFGQVEPSGATYTAIAGRTPMAGSVPGTSLLQDGSALQGVRDITINIANGRNPLFQVGDESAFGVSDGDFDVTLSLNVYLVDLVQSLKFQNGTRFSLLSKAKDQDDGHEYWFEFPRLVFTQTPKSTQDNIVIQQAQAFAEEDATLQTKMVIHERINR